MHGFADLERNKPYNGVLLLGSMARYLGETGEVLQATPDDEHLGMGIYRLSNSLYWWHETMLEGIPLEDEARKGVDE